jgi:microcystin degradation protein MlrC
VSHPRIAVGGFQHETNTFAALPATLADFEAPDAWPGLVRGTDLLDAVQGINLPAAGFVDEARAHRFDLLPLAWCSAQPSGRVSRDAFEGVCAILLEGLRTCSTLDAVYLDLHGAMVAEHVDDADGELLERVRRCVGPGVRIIASLDFHANLSPRMVEMADALVGYRTYPHVDMAETGARACSLLREVLRAPLPVRRHQALPFLIPLTSQCTLTEPMQTVMERVRAAERTGVSSLSFFAGFPAADVPECGPGIVAYGRDAEAVGREVADIHAAVLAQEGKFSLDLATVPEAVELARLHDGRPGHPLILADTQDNPGAGGNADTTTLLKALVAAAVPGTLAGVIWDPEAAAIAHAAGEGARIELALGARTGFPGETPLRAIYTVQRLGDGRFTGTGPFYRGGRFELGPMALLALGNVRIVVASRKQQAADQAMFRHVGAEPSEATVLMLKSSVHFRADFGPIAGRVVLVAAPGPNPADPASLPFSRLPTGMRLQPRGAPLR